MSSAISFNLDHAKILSSGNGLKAVEDTVEEMKNLPIMDYFCHCYNVWGKSNSRSCTLYLFTHPCFTFMFHHIFVSN